VDQWVADLGREEGGGRKKTCQFRSDEGESHAFRRRHSGIGGVELPASF
jgi:hypothetical protein